MDIGAFWGVRGGSAGRSVWTMNRCVVVRFNTDIIGRYLLCIYGCIKCTRSVSRHVDAHTHTPVTQ